MSLTFQEFVRYAFSPDGRDTTRDLSDGVLARAIADTGNLFDAAVALSEQHGRIVARTDIVARVEVSPELQHILEAAQAASMQRVLTKGLQRLAERRRERRAVDAVDAADGAEPGQGIDPTSVSTSGASSHARAAMSSYPNDALCGARTRRGTACRRIVEPGARRCRLHGGMSTGPRTPEGRQRIADAQRARWRRYRESRRQ